MAKKEVKPKAVLERVYNVPLRKEFQKAPIYRRTKKAVSALKQYISKHMKSEDVKIGIYANQYLWKDGIRNPPHHIKVNAVKDDKGTVTVELVELTGKAKREQEKKAALEKAKEAKDKQKEAAKNPLTAATAKKDSKADDKKVVDVKAEATDLEKAVEAEAPAKEEVKTEEKPVVKEEVPTKEVKKEAEAGKK